MICPLFLRGRWEVVQSDEGIGMFAALVERKPLALNAHFEAGALDNVLVVCSCEMNYFIIMHPFGNSLSFEVACNSTPVVSNEQLTSA